MKLSSSNQSKISKFCLGNFQRIGHQLSVQFFFLLLLFFVSYMIVLQIVYIAGIHGQQGRVSIVCEALIRRKKAENTKVSHVNV